MRVDVMIIVKIVFSLLAIQLTRAGLLQLLLMTGDQAILYHSFILVALGVLLYLVFRPKLKDLGLELHGLDKRTRRIYATATIVVILLAIASPSNYSGNVEDIISSIESVLIYPIFEELVFRGYIWSKLEEHKLVGMKAYLITALLFGIWHLGYLDVIYIKSTQNFPDSNINDVMFYKFLIGTAYGVFTGFTRYKTKNAYSSIIVHSFLNIFGR
jgi:membrane protease YdiL (CAAX protease family)